MSTENQLDRITPPDLQALKCSTFVREVEHHSVLPSTNSRALELASLQNLNLPVLVLADRQTSGRGRGGNQWWSAPGALTFSLIMECPKPTDGTSWLRIALTSGMAVCETLHQLCPGLDIGLKWPNDVYVNRRKICGLLVEKPPQAGRRLVLGIGLNVNNSTARAPASVGTVATSLVDVAGYPFSLSGVLVEILRQLSAHLTLLQHDTGQLQQRWESYCLLTERTVRLASGSRKITGKCLGINADGALLLQTSNGVESCFSGEVIEWS